jgi:acyl carrier protein
MFFAAPTPTPQNTSKFCFPDSFAEFKIELKSKIIVACQVKGLTPLEIDDTALIINGPGPLFLDSLDAVEIAVMVQNNFGVKIQDLSTAKAAMKSVDSLATHVWIKSGRSV